MNKKERKVYFVEVALKGGKSAFIKVTGTKYLIDFITDYTGGGKKVGRIYKTIDPTIYVIKGKKIVKYNPLKKKEVVVEAHLADPTMGCEGLKKGTLGCPGEYTSKNKLCQACAAEFEEAMNKTDVFDTISNLNLKQLKRNMRKVAGN